MVRVRTNKAGANSHPVPLFAYVTIYVCTPQIYAKRRKTKNFHFSQKNNQKLLHNKKQCVYLHRGWWWNHNGRGRFREPKRNRMETLTFSTKQINRNFIIKVSGLYNNEKINKAVGVSGFLTLVDDIALANRLLERAFDCPNDKCECKLRRGIKFTFYCH